MPTTETERFETHAWETMQKRGFRRTMGRTMVARVLAKTKTPLTAHQIQGHIVQDGGRIDVVSVYRNLESFAECGLCVRVGISDAWFRVDPGHDSSATFYVVTKNGHTEQIADRECIDLVSSILRRRGQAAEIIRIEVRVA